MIIISAMSENRVIGIANGMPWNVPEEYDQYLRFVSGQTVIMGRKTYDVFGSDLSPGTSVIVISRGADRAGADVVGSLDEALALADRWGKEVFVAGGGSIYSQAVPRAQEMYLSTIKGDFQGDTYFPEFDARQWDLSELRDEPNYVFRKYLRKPAEGASCDAGERAGAPNPRIT